jgi:hypothetical protein
MTIRAGFNKPAFFYTHLNEAPYNIIYPFIYELFLKKAIDYTW